MVEALVNPKILVWARERAGFTVQKIAEKLSVKSEKVESWESGDKKPTFRQAQTFADKTYIPFGYLFLSAPPQEKLPLPDLRTIGDHPVGRFSLDLKDTIRNTVEQQEWFKDFCQKQDYSRLDWVGSATVEDFQFTLKTANHLLNNNTDKRPKNFENYFRTLINKIEKLGVLVMRNSIVGNNTHRPLDRNEFRGFAITDSYAPVIFINANDAKQAQIFTLLHEFAHLLINKSGVSDLSHRNENIIEKFCNRVAAEFLVPTDEFRIRWNPDFNNWKFNLPVLESHFHVSQWVIARRALECDFITESQYWEHYKKILESLKKEKNGLPSYGLLIKMRYSRTLTEAIASEALSGRMLLRDAQHLTGIHPGSLKEFAKKEFKF
ncbi:ImmA/IrrE family metallo-endopeptidase [Salmonella enterica]|nr:ImmA/IrrE family metallo-endopeptidase [Salmonella enterica]